MAETGPGAGGRWKNGCTSPYGHRWGETRCLHCADPVPLLAPWDSEQVGQLNRYQKSGVLHPFTCGNDHGEPRVLMATRGGWVCSHEGCTYTQNWAHRAMANGEWLDMMEQTLDALGVPRHLR